MVRFLCGDELADMLGVNSRSWTSLLTRAAAAVRIALRRRRDHVPIAGRISAHFAPQLLEGLSWVARGGERAPFRIPQELAERWDARTLGSDVR